MGCGAPSQESGGEEAAVLAEVDGDSITEADVDARIAELPQLARPEFSGPVGRARMLEKILEEETLYRAAREEGFLEDSEIRRQSEAYHRQLVVQTFLERKQAELTRVSEEEAREFYEAHQEDYMIEKALRVRLLLNESEKIVRRAREMVVEGLHTMPEACTRFTTHNELRAAGGLIPTWVRKNRAIPWLGNHPRFHEVVFSLEKGEISELFQTSLGFHIATVEEVREPALRPFEAVRADIEGRIARERSTTELPKLLSSLRERYNVRTYGAPGRSMEQIYAEAQSAPNPTRRVQLYEELVALYPDSERALESWFMIGFIRSEELKDKEGANAAFQRVIEIDSDSELARSARWMLTSGDNEFPSFEDDLGPPGSQEDTP